MKHIKILFFVVALGCMVAAAGCGGGGSTNTNAGYKVRTLVRLVDPFTNNYSDILQGATVIADFQSASGTTTGTVEHFNQSVFGNATFTSARVPGDWRFRAFGYAGCFGVVADERVMHLNDTETLPCRTYSFGTFSAAPSSVDQNYPPESAVIYGSGISSTYGMPKITYYDEGGTLYADQDSISVAADGSSLTGPVPDFYGSYNGTYTMVISNVNSDGTTTIIGSAAVYVTGYEPPPPPDPGGCGGGYYTSKPNGSTGMSSGGGDTEQPIQPCLY